MSNNYIIRCHRRLGSVAVSSSCSWSQLGIRCRRCGRLRALGPQRPTVEQPSQNVKEVLLWSEENWDQYVAVCPRLQLTSHTQPTSTLSRIKCERYTFIKKCVRSFVHLKFVIIVDYISAYIFVYVLCICMWLYNRGCNLLFTHN